MSPTFQSLSIRNYRLWFIGGMVSNIGTWAGRVGQDWLVLTELTPHSATALGIVTGLQFLPILLLAPWAGAMADRFDKRTMLILTQAGLLLTTLVLGLLAITGTAVLWHVYVIATLQGILTAVDNPTRQAFVPELVGREHLPNAVGLNSASFNLGRLVGPGLAGVVIAVWGTGQALLLNSVSFVFILGALAMLRRADLRPSPRLTGRGGIRAGLAYVNGRRDLKLIMGLIFVLGTFGMNFQITTALMATQAFHKGAGEYGLLGSVMAVGSLTAALRTAGRKEPRLWIMLAALGGFAVSSTAAALAPNYVAFAVLLVPVGFTALTAMTVANTLVQTRVDPVMRGRVMALYMAIFVGGTPIGAPVIGWIGEVAGPRWTILVGSIAVLLTLAVVSHHLLREENVHVTWDAANRPHFNVHTTPRVTPLEEPMPESAR